MILSLSLSQYIYRCVRHTHRERDNLLLNVCPTHLTH